MPAAFPDFIRIRLERAGVELDPARLSLLAVYFGLLTKWNETVNLTALALNPASDEAIDRLLAEPLLAAEAIQPLMDSPNLPRTLRLLDVGSGGGSPAIPLAIALGSRRPVELRMVESRVRKAAFLRDAVRQIPLPEAAVFNARLEDLAEQVEHRSAFGLASMRAVRADTALWNALAWFVAPRGLVLWFQSANETEKGSTVGGFDIEMTGQLLPASRLTVLRKLSG